MTFRCLTIAGSDSGGGAGIQADLKVFHSLGCFGTSAITCLTAQNTKSIQSIFPVSSNFVKEQIIAVLDDIGIDCIKLGMLFNSDIIHEVARQIGFYKSKQNFKVVVDPVMVSKSGVNLLEPLAIRAFIKELLPLADILTPNLPEASVLLNRKILTEKEMEIAARQLVNLGANTVVLKGGHSDNTEESNDFYYSQSQTQNLEKWLKTNRIDTKNNHGTGCTFSAAICAFLARGQNVLGAVINAKDFLSASLESGKNFQLGDGHGPAMF